MIAGDVDRRDVRHHAAQLPARQLDRHGVDVA
jgi:hypothetical protein